MAGRGESPRKAWKEGFAWSAHSRGWGRKKASHRGLRPEWAMVRDADQGCRLGNGRGLGMADIPQARGSMRGRKGSVCPGMGG